MNVTKSDISWQSNSVNIRIHTSGWVIIGQHQYRQTHECAYRVDSIDISFELDQTKSLYVPHRLNYDGAWANKEGKKWMENQRYIGWGNNEWVKFVNAPQPVKNAAYNTFSAYLEATIDRLTTISTKLKQQGKFIYKMDANNAGWDGIQSEDSDGSNPANIFMPSVSESTPSPLLGGDVTKWRIAMEYLGMPVPKRRSRKSSAGNNSSEV